MGDCSIVSTVLIGTLAIDPRKITRRLLKVFQKLVFRNEISEMDTTESHLQNQKKTIELCNEWILHLHNTHNVKKEAIDDRDSLLERVREEKKEGN